jgi:hypothetical protein
MRVALVCASLLIAAGCQRTGSEPTPTDFVNSLTIDSPRNGAVICNRTGTVVVQGHAPPNSTVSRNIPNFPDEQLPVDSSGRWSWTRTTDQDMEHYTLDFHLAGDDLQNATVSFEYESIGPWIWDDCTSVDTTYP